MVIYVIVCSENLKVYIGQHTGADLQHYLQQKLYEARNRLKARSHLYAALRKHPRDTWSIHPLVSGIELRSDLDALERHYIRVLKTQHPEVGYNICDGGEGFTGPHTDEAKRKISEHHKGINYRYVNGFVPVPQEEIERRRAKQTGQKRTAETCRNISAAKKALGHGVGQTHTVSAEARKRIGEANAKTWTPERRATQGEVFRKMNLARRKKKTMSQILLPVGYPNTIIAGTEIFGKDVDPLTVSVSGSGAVSGGQVIAPNGTKDTKVNLAGKANTSRLAGQGSFGLAR